MIGFSSRFNFVVPIAVASTIPQLTHFSRSEAQHFSNSILVKKRVKFNIYNPFMNKKNKRCFSTDDELSNEKSIIFFFLMLLVIKIFTNGSKSWVKTTAANKRPNPGFGILRDIVEYQY